MAYIYLVYFQRIKLFSYTPHRALSANLTSDVLYLHTIIILEQYSSPEINILGTP